MKLTFGADQTAVVANRTEVLKHKHRDGHHGQAHHKHHDPNRWAVRLCRRRKKNQSIQVKLVRDFCTSQSVARFDMCGRGTADGEMRREKHTVEDFVLNFVVQGLEKGFRCVCARGT